MARGDGRPRRGSACRYSRRERQWKGSGLQRRFTGGGGLQEEQEQQQLLQDDTLALCEQQARGEDQSRAQACELRGHVWRWEPINHAGKMIGGEAAAHRRITRRKRPRCKKSALTCCTRENLERPRDCCHVTCSSRGVRLLPAGVALKVQLYAMVKLDIDEMRSKRVESLPVHHSGRRSQQSLGSTPHPIHSPSIIISTVHKPHLILLRHNKHLVQLWRQTVPLVSRHQIIIKPIPFRIS